VIPYAGGYTENDLSGYVDDDATGVCCTDCTTEETTDDTGDTGEVDDTDATTSDDVVKEFHFIVNGKNMAEKSVITMQGWRCADNICDNDFSQEEVEAEARNWSDPASWTSGVVPVEGDFVEVEAGWNMIYDVEGDSPLFEMVTVMGRLTFYQPDDGSDVDLHMRTKHIYVAAGELYIG
jgi:hypothetical protein